MPNSTISPNMGLTIPTVAVDPGPDWANNINASLGVIDSHNHTPGNGVQITPSGLNINADLSMQGNDLTVARTVRFSPQVATLSVVSDIGCIYEVGLDLYYNDGNGTAIRLTQNGAIAGTPGSISGLVSPASASYSPVSHTFVFQSAALTPANIDGASLILRNLSASSFGITLSPPNALSSDYSITLPSLPGSTLPVSISATGSMSAAQITTAQIASNAVTTALIANANVTRAKLVSVGQQVSASSGSFATSLASVTPVTNLSVTITTTGRPVMLIIQDDGLGSESYIGLQNAAGGAQSADFYFFRGSTQLTAMSVQNNSAIETFVPPSSLMYLDVVAAGTYTYTLKASSSNASNNTNVHNSVLVAYEL